MMLTKTMWITGVLLVPKFKTNIISVALLAERGFPCLFDTNFASIRIRDKNGETRQELLRVPRLDDTNIYSFELPHTPYEPPPIAIDGKKLNSQQLMSFLNSGEYVQPNGSKARKPTSIVVRNSNKIPKKAAQASTTSTVAELPSKTSPGKSKPSNITGKPVPIKQVGFHNGNLYGILAEHGGPEPNQNSTNDPDDTHSSDSDE